MQALLIGGGTDMQKNNFKTALLISSFLLQYPDAEWMETIEEALKEAENIKQETYVKPLLQFLNYVKETKELDLAELYVRTFDFTKNTNLYLTYYQYKEDKKRGEALLYIKKQYRESGLDLSSKELPDFLPTVLEFTALTGKNELLFNYKAAIANMFEGLSKGSNPYSYVLESVLLALDEASPFKDEEIEVIGGMV